MYDDQKHVMLLHDNLTKTDPCSDQTNFIKTTKTDFGYPLSLFSFW